MVVVALVLSLVSLERAPPTTQTLGVAAAPDRLAAAAASADTDPAAQAPPPAAAKPQPSPALAAPATAEVDAAGPAARARPSSRAASEAASRTFATIDACGQGAVELALSPDQMQAYTADPLPAALGAPARAAAWPQLLVAMAASPDPRLRAARWMLQASGAPRQDTPGLAPSTLQQERLAAVQALAELAAAGSDTTLWAWAASACAQADAEAPPACAEVGPAQRVQRLPQDASAWLALAATLGAEAAAQADAMRSAAAAPRLGEPDGFALAAAVIDAWPPQLPEHLQEQLVTAAIGVAIATIDSTGFTAIRWCVAPQAGTVPEDRQAPCEALARKMQDQGRDLLSLALARNLGERLGWPAEEVQAMRQRGDAAMRAIVQATSAHVPLTCASVQATRRWVRDVHRLGERAAAQALLQAPDAAAPGVASDAAPRRRPDAEPPSSAPQRQHRPGEQTGDAAGRQRQAGQAGPVHPVAHLRQAGAGDHWQHQQREHGECRRHAYCRPPGLAPAPAAGGKHQHSPQQRAHGQQRPGGQQRFPGDVQSQPDLVHHGLLASAVRYPAQTRPFSVAM